jgi:uncharacterized membrane protein YebE (DUF533 family)
MISMLKENALIISAATACGAVLFGFMERQNQGAAPNWARVARNSAFGGVAGFTAVAGYLQAKKATQGAGAEIWVGCGISAGVLAASIYSQYQQHTTRERAKYAASLGLAGAAAGYLAKYVNNLR